MLFQRFPSYCFPFLFWFCLMALNINIVTFLDCSVKIACLEVFSIFSFEFVRVSLHSCFKTRVSTLRLKI